MLHIYFLAHKAIDRLGEIHESTVGSASRFAAELNFHMAVPSSKILRMKEVVNGARVMGNRIVEVLGYLVLLLEKKEQIIKLFGKICVQFSQLLEDILIYQDRMGHFQRDHGHFDSAIEHNVGGFRVYQNIKLGRWTPIAKSNCSTHNCNSFQFIQNIRKSFNQNGQIRHSSCHDKVNLLLLCHNEIVN